MHYLSPDKRKRRYFSSGQSRAFIHSAQSEASPMKKAILICIAALSVGGFAATSTVMAATSPKQRAAEVKAVVDAVSRELPKNPINTVMYIRANNFEVLAGTCTVRAHIVSSKATESGKPDKIKVRLNRQRCTR
jgi:hypothetical protein